MALLAAGILFTAYTETGITPDFIVVDGTGAAPLKPWTTSACRRGMA